MTEKNIGALSVSSLYLMRVEVYVGVGVCIRTHTHTLQTWGTRMWAQGSAHTHTHCTYGVLRCEPRGQDETPGGPEEFRWTKSRHICIRIRAQSTHVYVYDRRWDEILDWLLFPLTYFLFQKQEMWTQTTDNLKSKISHLSAFTFNLGY